jgi:tetratricopeptide (TPR) repeat protein
VASRYLLILLLPLAGQSLVHDLQPLDGSLFTGLSFLAAYAVFLFLAYRKHRLAFFALAAIPVALSPFNTILPKTTVLFAERYLYFAVPAAALLFALLLLKVPGRIRPGLIGGALLLFGLTLSRTSLWSDGVEVFADAHQKNPGSWLAAMKLGEARTFGGLRPGAAEAFDAAVRNAGSPLEEARARVQLSGVLLGEGRWEEALEAVHPAGKLLSEVSPEAAGALALTVHLNRAAALVALDRGEDAVEAYRAAARSAPNDARPLAGLAAAYARLDRMDEALEAARAGLKLDPDEDSAVAMAEVFILANDIKAARDVLAKAIEEGDRPVRALCLAGELSLAGSRPAEARKRFERALELSPEEARAVRGLAAADLLSARAAWAMGDSDKALSLARRAADRRPDDPGPLIFLAATSKDRAEAERLLSRASTLPGGDPARDVLAGIRLAAAKRLLSEGDEKAAARAVKSALEVRPQRLRIDSRVEVTVERDRLREAAAADPEGPLLAGLAAFLAGEQELAEILLTRAYRQAVESGTGNDVGPLALVLRGRSRLRRGAHSGAHEDFTVLTTLRPGDPWPLLYRAQAQLTAALEEKSAALARGEEPDVAVLLEGAREDARRAADLSPDLMEPGLRLGEIEFAAGNYVDSIRHFERAKREHPDRIEPMLDLAGLYKTHFLITEDKEYLRGAQEELQKGLALSPENPRLLAAHGEVLLLGGQTKQAAISLGRAVAADPALAEAKVILADLYVRAGRSRLDRGGPEAAKEAKELAQRAIALGTRKAGAHLLLADVARMGKDFRPALEHLTRAKEIAPDSAEVKDALAAYHKALGYAYLFTARRSKEAREEARKRAFEEFQKAVDAGSEKEDLGQVRVLLGLDEPDPAVPLPPRVAEILAERTAEARKHFEESVRLSREGDLDGAAAAAERSLAARVSGEAWFQLARVRSAQDRDDDAESAYRAAVAAKPSLAVAWLNLGSLLYVKGELKEAREAYQGYLRAAHDADPETVRKVRALVEEIRRKLDE